MTHRAFIARVETAWREQQRTPSGARLTRLHVHIAAKLACWRSSIVRQRALARSARCSVRTVQRALARLHGLGLLSWTRRVIAGPGWRAQVANRYALLSASFLDYQCLRTSVSLSHPAPSTAPADLLEARRRAMAERLAAGFRPPGRTFGPTRQIMATKRQT